MSKGNDKLSEFDTDITTIGKMLKTFQDELEQLEDRERTLINLIRDSEDELEDLRDRIDDLREKADGLNELLNDYSNVRMRWALLLDQFPDISIDESPDDTPPEDTNIKDSDIDFMDLIRQSYIRNELKRATSKGQIIGKNSAKYDCVVFEKYLYIREESIERVIHSKYPNVEKKAWIKYLDDIYALKYTDKKTKTIQLPGCNTIKFYAIRIGLFK